MMVRISFHIGFDSIKTYKYENIYVPIPKVGDIVIFSKSDLDHSFYGSNITKYYNPLFQFTIKSMDYLYLEENVCVYINLLKYNKIKSKSDSVGSYINGKCKT
ncbi:hypothetical protein [Clostridium estertheticum]|uniref:hypothetical protein n=1 Tax=Clostridium estertheticum TaxID=238834 RepID=UPI001C0AEE1A|nr:hypothetical protein [Clostridium estertheticum]MBU3173337.1 hypothetical protein [Clostridium estertheticum]